MEQQILQEQKKSNALAFQIAISFAIYILALTVVMRILKVNPQAQNVPVYLTVLSILLAWGTFIFAVSLGQLKDRKQLGGFITYGRAFSTGFKVAAYAGLFTGILLFAYYQFIDPAALTEMMEVAMAKAKSEQEVKGIEMMSKYMGVMTAFGTAITYTFVGVIISLISAAIVKRDRPLNYEDPQ